MYLSTRVFSHWHCVGVNDKNQVTVGSQWLFAVECMYFSIIYFYIIRLFTVRMGEGVLKYA